MEITISFKELKKLNEQCSKELNKPVSSITCVEFYAWMKSKKLEELK